MYAVCHRDGIDWRKPHSPHDSKTIYVGANKVFKSTDRGDNWTAISGDLTSNTDRETLSLMGVVGKEVRIAKNDGVQSYGNIVQLVESTKQAGVLYAGTDDGRGCLMLLRICGPRWGLT